MAAINLKRTQKFETKIEALNDIVSQERLNLRNEILSWDTKKVIDILGEWNVLNVGFIKRTGNLSDNDQCFDEVSNLSDLSRLYFWTVYNENGERADSHIDYWFFYDADRGVYTVEFYGATIEEYKLEDMLKMFLHQLIKEDIISMDLITKEEE